MESDEVTTTSAAPSIKPKPKAKPSKYHTKAISEFYREQDLDPKKNVDFAADTLERDLAKAGPGADLAKMLKLKYGWTQEEYERYAVNRKQHKVDYFNAKQRRQHRVFVRKGALLESDGETKMDTSSMSSKFAGPGYGIFVLSPLGRLYAAQHKVGVLAHLSFLAGGDIAGAGEIKVLGGRLAGITTMRCYVDASAAN